MSQGIRRNRAGPFRICFEGCGTKTRSVGMFLGMPVKACECPEDSYPPIAHRHPVKGLSYGPLRPETSPHLLLGAWCEDAGLLGGRSDSKAVLSRVFNPAHLGIDFRVEILSKSHLGQPPPHAVTTNPRTRSLPMNPGNQPKISI